MSSCNTRLASNSIAVCFLATILFFSAVTPPASAWMGDCGKPTAAGGTNPVGSDALYTLQAAVGSEKCPLWICDVSGNGSIKATDALQLLKFVTGIGSLGCAACSGAQCITNCDEGDVIAAIDHINTIAASTSDNPNPQLLTKYTSVVFKCNSAITLTDATWGSVQTITRDGVIFRADDGQDAIVFQPDTVCYHRCLGRCNSGTKYCSVAKSVACTLNSQCSGLTPGGQTCVFKDCTQNTDCGATGPCSVPAIDECFANADCGSTRCSDDECPRIRDNVQRFLKLDGDDITVSDIVVRGFFKGIEFNGLRGTVDAVTFDRNCDVGVQNQSASEGNVVKNLAIQDGCDDCVRDFAGSSIGACSGDMCYHVTYQDVTLSRCKTPIRLGDDAAGGDFLFSGGSQTTSGGVVCEGSVVGASTLTTTFDDFDAQSCQKGIRFGAGSHTVQNSEVRLNTINGLTEETAGGSLTIRDSAIRQNNGAGQTNAAGVLVTAGSINVGTNADPGDNCLYGNVGSSSNVDVNNQTGTEMKAEKNWWWLTTEGSEPVSSRFIGSVDRDPDNDGACPH